MEIIKILKAGHLVINQAARQLEIAGDKYILPYNKIDPSAWGYVYEKYVGQVLQSEHFEITYNGFNGFADQGVDLIAEKGGSVTFIQCKYSQVKKLGKSHIDQILYKASKRLLKEFNASEKRLAFALIVHDKSKNFRRTAPKGLINTFSSSDKFEYPWLQYFLSYNHLQSKIKVGFREIPMNI